MTMKSSFLRAALASLIFAFLSPAIAADYPSPIFKDLDVRGVLKLPGTGYPKATGGGAATYSPTVPFADIAGQATLAQLPTIDPGKVLCNATGAPASPTDCTTLPSGLTIPGPMISGWVALPGTGYVYANGGSVATYSTSVPSSVVSYSQGGTGALSTTVQTWLRSRAVDMVVDFGADPTGVSDSTTACNNAAATGKPVYVPDGTYKLTDICTLQNGQIMYGDGRTNSVFSVDAASFNMAALGVLRLGTAEPGAQLMDVGITFVQPDTAVRANINAYPPALYANGAARFIIDRVRVSAGNKCLDATGNAGGSRIGVFECGSLSDDAGIEFNGAADFVHIESIQCWPYGMSGTTNLYPSVYSDQTTKCLKIGQVDGLAIDKLGTFRAGVTFTTSAASTSIAYFINELQADGNGSDVSVSGGRVKIGKMYSTKTSAEIGTPISVSNASAHVDIGNLDFRANDAPQCSVSVTAGDLTINRGVFFHTDVASSAACVSSTGSLRIYNSEANIPTTNRTAAFFDQSGASASMQLVNVMSTASGGATGNAFSFANDNAGNKILGSVFPSWAVKVPSVSAGFYEDTGTSPTGSYERNFRNDVSFWGSAFIRSPSALRWYSSEASADQKLWDCFSSNSASGTFTCRAVNDAYSVANQWVTVTRSGVTISNVTFPSSLIFSSYTGYLKGAGASAVTASATVPLSDLAAQATNTITGNAAAGSAAPTALTIGSCSTSASALQWTTNSGFGCNTAIDAATLGGATFAAPGAIGGGTPSTGAFTTVSVGGNQIIGARQTGWGAPSGTLDRTALATYAGQTVSAAYVQAEAQATDNACKKVSQELGALITDLRTHGLIGN